VIDGQQRLTTLTLMLTGFRALLAGADQQALATHIFERGSRFAGTKDRCRVTLRQRDQGFFEENILRNLNLENLDGVAAGKLSDPQRKLVENTRYLLAKLQALDTKQRDALASFILQHAYLVVVSTPNLDSAFRIFSVLNDRGLDLSVADILKAEIIGNIPEDEQENYTENGRPLKTSWVLSGSQIFSLTFA
jgi:uncharacterized protein with ParB-like and HNH nuclease domain